MADVEWDERQASNRQQIAECLRREEAQVAERAAREVLPRAMSMLSRETQENDLPRNEEAMLALIAAGFRRLGAVVALAVVVDEPLLIADDLRWLRGMLGKHSRLMASADWIGVLTSEYGNACTALLDPESARAVAATLERALVALEGEEASGRDASS